MQPDMFESSGEFNTAQLVLLSSWGLGLLLLVGAVALLVLVLAWHNAQGQPRRRRVILVGLRALAVVTLLLLFLQPGVRLEHVSRVRNHVVVLVDASRSMALPGDRAETRLDAVKQLISRQKAVLDQWRTDHLIDFYAVSDRARPVADVAEVQPNGDATRLLTALGDIASRYQPQDLAAVLVFSDGADNGALGEAVKGDGDVPAPVRDAVARVGAPVHTFFTGPDEPIPDVAIADVAFDEFAFVHNAVSIEADVSVTGFNDLALPVTLRRDDTILATKVLQTTEGETGYHFSFEFVPDKIGKGVFTLDVGAGPGERILVNNRRQFVIRVIRDKIRVLQVSGRPSWDERFLRSLLDRNPNVDLISFFILRTSTNLQLVPREELSLIPFPTQELFEEQLGSFDLIIFQNFTHQGYHMAQYLPLIRDFVNNGGGFVMVGGDLSYASGGYAGTAIEEFLPVTLPADRTDLLQVDRFKPRLTEAGKRHPITALSLVPEENQQQWATLPELSGLNRVTGVKPDGTVLLDHPSRTVDGAAAPVVVAGELGQGRVLSVLTDSTWAWDFIATGNGGDNRHYYKFWGNAIRWLIKDPALQPVRVESDRDRYPLGTEVTLLTHVVGRDYQPAPDVPVNLEVERVWHDAEGVRHSESVLRQEGRSSEIGELGVRFTPPADGAYTVTAQASPAGGPASDDDVFIVAADPVELRDTEARRDTLAALARAGNGVLRTVGDDLEDLPRVEPRVAKVNRRKDLPLWASGWWLLIAIVFPSAEWYLRRRWGLL